MGEKVSFKAGIKSFELTDISRGHYRWFLFTEKSARFVSKIKIDEDNLRWICDNLRQASRGSGDLYRRWGRKQQNLLHRVYQNYNIYWRYIRIEKWVGDRKSAIIIPEAEYNLGWCDVADKITRFLGSSNPDLHRFTSPEKSYIQVANLQKWPAMETQNNT